MNTVVRKQEIYQSDDGRVVQVLTKQTEVSTQVDEKKDKESADFLKEQSQKNDLYVGNLKIPTPQGARTLSFDILGVKSIEEAFDRFEEFAEPAVKAFVEEVNKRMSPNQGKIITAPASALKQL